MHHFVDADIVFPVYVRALDDLDVKRYDEAKKLSWLEAVDVENGEYQAWDALGRRLNLSVSGGNVEFCLTASEADSAFGTVVEDWAKLYGRT